MTLLSQIKAAQLQARKARASVETAALTTVIGDAEAVGKAEGREPTDIEVIVVLKKFIKNTTETLQHAIKHSSPDVGKLTIELDLYNSFLPKQLTRDELVSQMKLLTSELAIDSPKGKGLLMKTLRERFEGQYDGAMAASVASEILSA